MKNQTIKNDPNNRGQNEQKELETKLRLIWLGRRFWNQTSEESLTLKKNQSPEQEVQEIRQLLDEDDCQAEGAQC